MDKFLETDLVVIGGGPGGYAAAFRAADLGLNTILIDSRKKLGGECLHVGCIPSKALLSVAKILSETEFIRTFGIEFTAPHIDIKTLRHWKGEVVKKFSLGLEHLAKRRGVNCIFGRAKFESSRLLHVDNGGVMQIHFKHAIVATGSRPISLPEIELDQNYLMYSAAALDLEEIPQKLLVVGGGYIGLELGTIYASLGSEVTLVESTNGLLPSVDRDLVKPLDKRISELFSGVFLNTRILSAVEMGGQVEVVFRGEIQESRQIFDKLLISVGRRPHSNYLGLENTKINLNEKGFIQVDPQCRTKDERIFAVGDVAGEPMLAHKATYEGKVAAETIAGQPPVFEDVVIPAVVFTDPEVAWCGLTENQANNLGIQIEVTKFPWAASGRAGTLGRSEGLTKILFEPDTGRVLGVGIVGVNAGEIIAEGVLAVKMKAVAEDLATTVHTHPTLSETFGEAAEAFLGQATHIYR